MALVLMINFINDYDGDGNNDYNGGGKAMMVMLMMLMRAKINIQQHLQFQSINSFSKYGYLWFLKAFHCNVETLK